MRFICCVFTTLFALISPASVSHAEWVKQAQTGWIYHDYACSIGATPDEKYCQADGLHAICWDGFDVTRKGAYPYPACAGASSWCTYKQIPVGLAANAPLEDVTGSTHYICKSE
jgi:hypothetical protein